MYFTRMLSKSGSWSEWISHFVDWSFVFCRVLMTYTCVIALLASPVVVRFLQRASGGDVAKYLTQTARAIGVFWTGKAGAASASTFFTADEVSHLLDVHRVVMGLVFLTTLAVCWSILIEGKIVQEWLSQKLRQTSVLIAVISLPILAGFSFFFDFFHRVIFPQGNYTFAPESVLIHCFPPMFWMINVVVLQLSVVALLWLQSRHAEIKSI